MTSDRRLHHRALLLHGPIAGRLPDIPPEEPVVVSNFRISELSGAIALVQLQLLDPLVSQMRAQKAELTAAVRQSATRASGMFCRNRR